MLNKLASPKNFIDKNKLLQSLLIVMILCYNIKANAQSEWEVNTLRDINPKSPNSLFWKGISYSAEPLSVAVPVGMLTTAIITHDKKLKIKSFEVLGSLALASATTEAAKMIFNRPRPYETYIEIYPNKKESGKSFPSGHTTTAFSTAMSLTLISKKWYIAAPAFAWAASVGYSRMYLGQHYPSDVLMGAMVGTASAFVSHWLTKKISTRPKRIFKNYVK